MSDIDSLNTTSKEYFAAARKLWVAIDFAKREGYHESPSTLPDYLEDMIKNFFDLNVVLKFNSLLRFWGGKLYNYVTIDHKFKVCVDFKLDDLPDVMAHDASLWNLLEPDYLTMMCSSGSDGMKAVRDALSSKTKVFGIPVLTSFTSKRYKEFFHRDINDAICYFADEAVKAGIEGLMLAPKDIPVIRGNNKYKNLLIAAAGIRPLGSLLVNDDQACDRVETLEKTIELDPDFVVIGRTITKSNDPKRALLRTIKTIMDVQGKLSIEKAG